MASALNIAQTGLDAQQTRLAVIANNLANVATTGFKKSRPVFEDLLYETVAQPGAASSQSTELPSGLMLGTGVRTVATSKVFTQGELSPTDNALDVSIQGRGFLQVLMPDGSTAYTRDGTMSMNSQGQLVTPSGYEIDPGITIPTEALSITIGQDGTVSVLVAGQSTPTQVGQLQLADFINPQGLQPIGENLYKESVASGNPQTGTAGLNGLGTFIQGAVESSNVNAVEELVDMIEAQRSYEMNSKAIQTADEMMQFITQTL
ncbi:MAG: flagellar basal-body rod protein FlgG [Gammaproteobacteria bacterium]|nr:flagellar basal-body rod protein FlgG [Gammaproteobacteria bacterium]MCP5202304.1 flagellar basal-body rod protein FlgG [Gammaproteobacteria bacterium]